MRARILTAAAALAAAAILPARAADSDLVNLVMPDAKVLAGVNVDQAKTSAFGQYVLSQVPNTNLQQLTSATGFDPTQDVSEILAAAGLPGSKTGLVLARGKFDADKIAESAAAKGKAATETYRGVTILEDPNKTHGVAFLSNNTIAAAGDLASVKGAIDRQLTPGAALPGTVITQVAQWSGNEDAWVITTVPPASLHRPATSPLVPGGGSNGLATGLNNSVQNIQSAAGGVKFGGDAVTVTAQATADNAQDATNLANTLQLLASMAQLQTQSNPELLRLTQSLKVTTDGSYVNASFSLPETDLQAMLKPHPGVRRPMGPRNHPRVRQ